MSSLKDLHIELKSELEEITNFKFFNTWNNQYGELEEARSYAFALPACFIEIIDPVDWLQLGGGFQQADVDIVFHIIHEKLDDQSGGFEENFDVYDLRNLVVAKFTGYKPATGSKMFKVTDRLDKNHSNVYHYIVGYRTGFIETLTDDTNGLIDQEPPIELEVDGTLIHELLL